MLPFVSSGAVPWETPLYAFSIPDSYQGMDQGKASKARRARIRCWREILDVGAPEHKGAAWLVFHAAQVIIKSDKDERF